MNEQSYYDRIFEHLDYSDSGFCGIECESCTFRDCDFSNSNLSQNEFMDCTFHSCNLSTAVLKGSSLKNVSFTNSKLTGVDFGSCNPFLFAVSFKDCHLDYAVFDRNRLHDTHFIDCRIQEATFLESDLQGAVFQNCDLLRTTFSQNNLKGADFRTAVNYTIDPATNRVQKARFSYPGVLGLLENSDIIVE